MKPNVRLERVKSEDQETLKNLLNLYMHDMSSFSDLELDDKGIFGYGHFPLYWSEPDRYPYFIRVGGNLAGFMFVQDKQLDSGKVVHVIVEYFVINSYRRQGVGDQAACLIFDEMPGLWSVSVKDDNTLGVPFWKRVIDRYTGGKYEKVRTPEWPGPIYEFVSKELFEGEPE